MRGVLLALCLLDAAVSGQEVRTTQVAAGISNPTDIQAANDGSGRLFLVQQNGVIRILSNGSVLSRPFLDIGSKTTGSGERGLLGLAFPPGFAQSQRFYVHYTDLSGDTTVAQYRVTSDRNVADTASEIVLLKQTQPFANHNGGQLVFGPDGYLYLGLGDGGSGGDPQGNGQNRNTLLGKILRLDAESDPGRLRIPSGNPFANTAGSRGEIWAYGLRNPWRFSFDRVTRDLWIADVGQDRYEEIDFQPASSPGGENYGWNSMEGLHCYIAGCNQTGLVLPIAEYAHADGGCSVTGGYVYRGRLSPGLRGIYLYGDLCSGRIWGIERQGTTWVNRQLLASAFSITTFGQDEAGEIYVANAANGTIHRIDGSVAPRLSAAGVVNAASFATGIVPGSLATIFAAGLVDPPGVLTVAIDGLPAQILGVANRNGQEQANILVPAELAGRSTAQVVATRDGQASAPVTVSVFDRQPGAFAAVVHNADYTLVTAERPLIAGEYAFLYATGLGRDLADVRVSFGGQLCELQYAGAAPGFAGVSQVNFRVPSLPPGAYNVVVAVGASSAPPLFPVPLGLEHLGVFARSIQLEPEDR